MAAGPPISLKARALGWLAQREQSVAELRRKLLRVARRERAGPDSDETALADAGSEVEAVIEWLLANRHLSEERFVESRIHARAARYGNQRIRQELAQHGLSISGEAAQALKDSELARAAEVWRRKFGAPPVDVAERAHQSRFLAQRGFSAEVIGRVMRHAGEPPPDGD